MSFILKPNTMKYRDPDSGDYKGVDVIAERTTTEQVADITAEGATQVAAVQAASDAAQSILPTSDTLNNLSNDFAPQYSSSAIYAVGDYCVHNYILYTCKTAITTAESWTPAHWTTVSTSGELGNLKSAIDIKNTEIYDGYEPAPLAFENGWINSSGVYNPAAAQFLSNVFSTDNLIELVNDSTARIYAVYFSAYTSLSDFTYAVYDAAEIGSTITISKAYPYVAIESAATNISDLQGILLKKVSLIDYLSHDSVTAESVSVLFDDGVNRYDPSKAVDGYLDLVNGAELIRSGSYKTTDYIDVSSFTEGYYHNKKARKMMFYDANKTPIADSFVSTETAAGVVTLNANYKYARFSFADTLTEVMVADSNEEIPYVPYQEEAKNGYNYLNDNTKTAIKKVLSDEFKYQPDILSGKKWAVCGDSFTAGADSGTLSEGKYAGHKIVYPYIIGNRTNINVLNFFNNGRTLAMPAEPGEFVNSLTAVGQDWYYQNIPADVDYITIYLGINDNHHATGSSGDDGEDTTGVIPIGTISDNTTATYYGAWNVVLTWLIENRPFAHIGIIVTNGTTAAYREAQIAIATKYGIPYMDMNGDNHTPCMIRSCNSNIASAVRTAVNTKQRISSTNTHPNNDTHRFEATFIENFLRSL